MSTATPITAEYVATLHGADLDREVKKVGKAYAAAGRTLQNKTLDAALMAAQAVVDGLIARGSGGTKGRITAATFAGYFGLSNGSLVTRWVRVGVLLTEKGFGRDEEITQHMAHSGGANNTAVSKEIMREGSTRESIEEVWNTQYFPDGKSRSTAGNGTDDEGSTTGNSVIKATKEEKEAAAIKFAAATNLARCELAFDAIKSAIYDVDMADFVAFDEKVRKLLDAQIAKRATLTAKRERDAKAAAEARDAKNANDSISEMPAA